jgi:hypothetical protein
LATAFFVTVASTPARFAGEPGFLCSSGIWKFRPDGAIDSWFVQHSLGDSKIWFYDNSLTPWRLGGHTRRQRFNAFSPADWISRPDIFFVGKSAAIVILRRRLEELEDVVMGFYQGALFKWPRWWTRKESNLQPVD